MELILLRYVYNIELDNSSIIREKFLFSLLDKSNVALQHLHHRSNFFFTFCFEWSVARALLF